jgi:3,4-dihydroxy 2-butanone 4-phosphate synthase
MERGGGGAVHLLERAVAALRRGETVLLYDADGREGETDLVVASQFATPEAIRLLRTDGGGLLCTTVAPEHHAKLGLPFLADLLHDAAARHPVLAAMKANDLRYDPSRSSFGLTINHRKTFTGITDDDRSLTITRFADLSRLALRGSQDALDVFGKEFRAPGHVHLCVGADKLLHQRQGHTEIGVALARLAGVTPVLAGCEMLADTGRALSKADAAAWAAKHGAVIVDGKDVEKAWLNLEAKVPASG